MQVMNQQNANEKGIHIPMITRKGDKNERLNHSKY